MPILGILGLIVTAFFGGFASRFLESQLTNPSDKQIGVVDEAGFFTPLLPDFREGFQLFTDVETGRAALLAEEISSLAVIPPDYLQTGSVRVLTSDSGFQAATLEDSSAMRSFLVSHLLRDIVSPDIRQRVADPINPVIVSLDNEAGDGGGMSGLMFSIMVPYFMGILLVMTIFMSANYLLRGVAEEKSSRIIEIILSSVTARELLTGKVLGLGALGLLQVFVWLASVIAISGGAVAMLGAVAPCSHVPKCSC